MQYEECTNLHSWILNAQSNQKYVYYTGSYARDTHLSEQLQKLAYEQACKGKIYLVQEKERINVYKYIAIKASSPPRDKLIPHSKERENNTIRRYTKRNPKTTLTPAGAYNGQN